MRKYFILVFISFIICINCHALSLDQQEDISLYAKDLVEKGNLRKAKDGTVLLKYGSGTLRLAAFSDKLQNRRKWYILYMAIK